MHRKRYNAVRTKIKNDSSTSFRRPVFLFLSCCDSICASLSLGKQKIIKWKLFVRYICIYVYVYIYMRVYCVNVFVFVYITFPLSQPIKAVEL